jgi:precorrin-4 methylase
MAIKEGSRVKVFDHRLYEDDRSTPLSVTMRVATIKKVYQEDAHTHYKYSTPVADVVFDHRPDEISKGHFINVMEELEQSQEAEDGY